MIPDESNNTENNPPTVMHIHIAGSENIIIGSKVSGETVSIGNKDHSGASHTHRKNTRIKFVLGATLSGALLVIFSIYLKSNAKEEIQAFPVPANGKTLTPRKDRKPESVASIPQAGANSGVSIKADKASKLIALKISTNLRDQKEKSAIQSTLITGVRAMLSEAGIHYSENQARDAGAPAVTCRVDLNQKPVKFGVHDNLLENRLSLSITAENGQGAACYVKTFYSKPQVSDPVTDEGQAIQRCMDDVRKQIDVATLAGCLK